MSDQFDASQTISEALSSEILAEQSREVQSCAAMPSALANAKLHAVREMERAIMACNRLVWGGVPADMRAPSAEEAAGLLAWLDDENREKLIKESRAALRQRSLVAQMEAAEMAHMERARLEEEQLAAQEAERLEFEEFAAHDLADRPKRFEAWRASRRS